MGRFLLAGLIAGALGGLFTLPRWFHVLDDGHVELLASEVPGRTVKTYRIALRGDVILDKVVAVKTQLWLHTESTPAQKVGDPSTELYAPVVDPGASVEDPVHVVYRTWASGSELEWADPSQSGALRRPLEGVVRDAPLEGGLPKVAIAEFARQGVTLAPDVRVVDSVSLSHDRFWAYGVVGMFIVLGLLTAESDRLRRARSAQQ